MQQPPPPIPLTPEEEEAHWREMDEMWGLRFGVPQWLRDNPGLVITAIYVGASLVGVNYLFQFFRRFRINVLDYADASDFLMVVVREPLTIALALGGVAFYWLYMRMMRPVGRAIRKRWKKSGADLAKLAQTRERTRKIVPYLQGSFVLVYAVLFTLLYSQYQASRVRAGDYPRVTFEYKNGAIAAPPVTATFLGTTARFIFVYHADTKRAEAVPFDSIARLSWDARSGRERRADAEKAEAGKSP